MTHQERIDTQYDGLNHGSADVRKTFKVPAENVAPLQERFEKLNKRIARDIKRGVEGMKPLVLEVGPMFTEPQLCKSCNGAGRGFNGGYKCVHCDGSGRAGPDRVYAMVTLVSPEPPKANGWEFVAALAHVDGVGTVLRVVPGAQVAEGELAHYREASPDNCDHCKAVRQRKDTFILRKVG